MKTGRRSIFTLVILLVSWWSAQSYAQGRGHGHGREHGRDHGTHDHHAKEHKRDHHKKDREYRRVEHHHHHAPQRTRHVYHHRHQHSRHCEHRVVVHHHHHHERPRYVYYSDYDVYYDHHRHVYISYSGRNWTISASIPVGMRHVNVERVTYTEVEYYDDDFVTYLERGRPIYGRVHASIGF